MSASISNQDKELLIRLALAEARGEGVVGQALVIRSVLNRQKIIQEGTSGPNVFLTNGDSSIRSIINAPGQYQPVRDNRNSINQTFSNDLLLNGGKAYQLALNPSELQRQVELDGISSANARNLVLAPSFDSLGGQGRTGAVNYRNQTFVENVNNFGVSGDSIFAESSSPLEPEIATQNPVGEGPVPIQVITFEEAQSGIGTNSSVGIGTTSLSNARETTKGMNLEDSPFNEKFINSVSFAEAIKIYEKIRPLPDPCGDSELSQINSALSNFFNTVKGLKAYADLYINGAINKLKNLTSLIRSTAQIIGGILKTLINRLRDFLISQIYGKIREIIDTILPVVAKSIKNSIIQIIVDNIFCAFKDIINGLVNLITDFLFELVGKIVNVPFCAAQQFTNALVNNIAAVIDGAIGPLLDEIDDVLGGIVQVSGSVFEALDYILGFESFLCAKPNCPEIKEFKASPWGGPTQSQIDQFQNFANVPTAEGVIGSVDDYISNIEIFGQKIGDAGFVDSLGVTDCDPSVFECGPPSVEIFGGGGIGAAAETILDQTGRIIGVNITNRGSGYKTPPFVAFVDSCENTFTTGYAVISESNSSNNAVVSDTGGISESNSSNNAVISDTGGISESNSSNNAVISDTGGTSNTSFGSGFSGSRASDGEVIEIVLTSNTWARSKDGSTEFDRIPVETIDSSSDFVVCLDGFRILNSGTGYSVNDSISITPDIPNLQANVRISDTGQILEIKLTDTICGISGYPEIQINSPTGEGFVIEPKLSFIPIPESPDVVDGIDIVEIDSSISKPIPTNQELVTLRGKVVRIVDCVS